MKKTLVTMAVLLLGTLAFAQSTSLKVTFKFLNIVEGYDHDCKSEVFIDGESVGESGVVKESSGASFSVNVPTGKHDIKIVNYAKYEGEWEAHTVENEYSIDCIYEEEGHNFKKPSKLFLIHDIDQGTFTGWKKAPKLPKKKKEAAEG